MTSLLHVFLLWLTLHALPALSEPSADDYKPSNCTTYALHCAALRDDAQTLNAILDLGADPNFKDDRDRSPLHYAAAHNKTATTRALAERPGIDLSILGEQRKSAPAHVAAQFGAAESLKILLEKGATVDLVANNKTPLTVAVEAETLEVIRVLASAGAKLNPPELKRAPLHLAAALGKISVMELLLDVGADPNHRSENVTPLEHALSINTQKQAEAVVTLLQKRGVSGVTVAIVQKRHSSFKDVEVILRNLKAKGVDLQLTQTDTNGRTPLHHTIEIYQDLPLSLLKFLLESGAPVNAIDNFNQTPAHFLVQRYPEAKPYLLEAIKILIAAGANFNLGADKADSAFHRALGLKVNQKVIEAMLAAGADPILQPKTTFSSVYLVLYSRRPNEEVHPILDLLFSKGLDPDLTTHQETPLMYVLKDARRCTQEIVGVLLKYGANPKRQASILLLTKIALSVANKTTIAQLLIDAGATTGEEDLIGATKNANKGNSGLVRLLLSRGINPNVRDPNTKETALIMSLEEYETDPTSFEALAEKADLTLQDHLGYDVMHHLARRKMAPDKLRTAIKTLINRGASIDSVSANGETPIVIVTRYHPEYLEVFLEFKPDVKTADAEGNTPLHVAVTRQGQDEIGDYTKKLLAAGALVNERNKKGETPLHLYMQSLKKLDHSTGNWKVVTALDNLEVLLNEYKADPDIADTQGMTSLHVSVESGVPAFSLKLMLAGADPRQQNSAGKTPLDLAKEAGLSMTERTMTAPKRVMQYDGLLRLTELERSVHELFGRHEGSFPTFPLNGSKVVQDRAGFSLYNTSTGELQWARIFSYGIGYDGDQNINVIDWPLANGEPGFLAVSRYMYFHLLTADGLRVQDNLARPTSTNNWDIRLFTTKLRSDGSLNMAWIGTNRYEQSQTANIQRLKTTGSYTKAVPLTGISRWSDVTHMHFLSHETLLLVMQDKAIYTCPVATGSCQKTGELEPDDFSIREFLNTYIIKVSRWYSTKLAFLNSRGKILSVLEATREYELENVYSIANSKDVMVRERQDGSDHISELLRYDVEQGHVLWRTEKLTEHCPRFVSYIPKSTTKGTILCWSPKDKKGFKLIIDQETGNIEGL